MLDFKDFCRGKEPAPRTPRNELINNGSKGAREAIEFASSLTKMFLGKASKSTTSPSSGTVPTSLAGHQPRNGKFFVGSKVFQCHSKDKLYQRRHRSEPHRWSRRQTESHLTKFIKTGYQECITG